MKKIKSTIIKSLLLNDGINMNASIKEHVGTVLPRLLRCDTCGSLDYNNQIHIIWDVKFRNKLNYNERRFCILHEIGHYSNNHDGYKRDIYSETQADSYAVKYMEYDVAIKSMQGIYNKLNSKEAKAEFKERINNQVQIEYCKRAIRNGNII